MKLALQWKWCSPLALLLVVSLLVIHLCSDLFFSSPLVAILSVTVGIVMISLSFWITQYSSNLIDEMRQMITRMAQGDFGVRISDHAQGELGELGKGLNEMAGQLENRLHELARERAELNATLASMVEGVLLVDPAVKIRLVNRALVHQFDLPEEIIGKTVLEVFRNVPLHEIVSHSLVHEEIRDQELPFLIQEERIFNINAACLKNPKGDSIGAVVVFHDITHQKKLENMRKEFVANVSHELRTPLSMIKGYVETLLDEQPPDQQTIKQFMQTIQKHSIRLEGLINDLLTISALESQQANLHFEPVSIYTVATDIISELGQQAQKKSISISLKIPKAISSIACDTQRLNQVFFNLLGNAIKYTQTGGSIVVSAEEKEKEIEISIADNGPGIPPEHLPHVFERFYRVDKARSREVGGTGLGLSIVKHIVQAHGGRVWVESKEGKGSSFYFTMPKIQNP